MEQEEHLREAIRQIQDDPELCRNLTQMYSNLGMCIEDGSQNDGIIKNV